MLTLSWTPLDWGCSLYWPPVYSINAAPLTPPTAPPTHQPTTHHCWTHNLESYKTKRLCLCFFPFYAQEKKCVESDTKVVNANLSARLFLISNQVPSTPSPLFFRQVHNRGYTLKLRRLESQCWACILGEHNTGLCSFSSEGRKNVLSSPSLIFHFSDIHCRYCCKYSLQSIIHKTPTISFHSPVIYI